MSRTPSCDLFLKELGTYSFTRTWPPDVEFHTRSTRVIFGLLQQPLAADNCVTPGRNKAGARLSKGKGEPETKHEQ